MEHGRALVLMQLEKGVLREPLPPLHAAVDIVLFWNHPYLSLGSCDAGGSRPLALTLVTDGLGGTWCQRSKCLKTEEC